MPEQLSLIDLHLENLREEGTVECLGLKFSSEEERRNYFSKILEKKLRDPNFKNQDGFPKASVEQILKLSDPPYYTACPNPFLPQLIEWLKTRKPNEIRYQREAFSADVTEGKNDPVYSAHSYHTKVPHKAIIRYLLHYTSPGDVVFDGFCGTGMTGLAASLCGDRKTIESLGYAVDNKGVVKKLEKGKWIPFSKLGARTAILNDLSPAATFISYNYNTSINAHTLQREATRIAKEISDEFEWMYLTLHEASSKQQLEAKKILSRDARKLVGNSILPIAKINHILWSEVLECGKCREEIVYWSAVVDEKAKKVRSNFSCPKCKTLLAKSPKGKDKAKKANKVKVKKFDETLGVSVSQVKMVPVLINYSFSGKKFSKKPDAFDLQLLKKVEGLKVNDWYPQDRMPEGSEARRNDDSGATHVHHFYSKRNLAILASYVRKINALKDKSLRNRLMFAKTASERITSKLASVAFSYYFNGGGGFINAGRKGTLYVSSVIPEVPALTSLVSRLDTIHFEGPSGKNTFISTQSSTKLNLPDSCLDYLFMDPPFGSNIFYSELNFLWEAWLRVVTNITHEAIENRGQNKRLAEYQNLMTECFREAFRVLKPGRWFTLVFSNTQAAVWNALQKAIIDSGFEIVSATALNKKQGSVNAYTTNTAVKQDLAISAIKPKRAITTKAFSTGSKEEMWTFIENRLTKLSRSSAKNRIQANERDPRILFDRAVAHFVSQSKSIPLSSGEFLTELEKRFSCDDGLYFIESKVKPKRAS
ncbi:MAG: DNA methylase [Bdellovibrionales bacterium]|nr:DNA methylase [Bdellovibrionales bacterium]